MPEIRQIVTNKHNLPAEVFAALTKNRYVADEEGQDQRTDYSISAIIAPAQQTVLRRRYQNCNTEDAIDRVWSLFGSIAHSLLEEHGSDDSVVEKRFYKTVHGRVISGQVDHYKDRKITDYKTTSAWKIKKRDYDDWARQLNSYSLLCEEAGLPVDSIRIVAIIRDWSEKDYEQDRQNYPQAPIVVLPLVKWSKDIREQYVTTRVDLLLANELLPDEGLTPCTDRERWRSFTGYAVIKDGNDKATKVFKDIGEILDAEAFARDKGANYQVTTRFTEPRRCLKYCNVSSVCHQHRAYLASKESTNGSIE